MICSTRHHLKDLNIEKRKVYLSFLEEYSRVVILMVDKIWETLPDDLKVSKFLDYKVFGVETNLSSRALSSAITQASSIVRGSIEKQKRRLWVRENRNYAVKDVKFSKPILKFVAPNLSSKCCDIIKGKGKFWGFVRIRSIGKAFGAIKIPIIKNPRIIGDLKAGVIFKPSYIQLAWEQEKRPHEQGSKIIGVDQGYKTVATLSDGQSTPKECPHGHTLESVIAKLSRKKKGSLAFRRAQDHRRNFINWSINQLNFSGLKELRLEKIINIRFRRNAGRKMSHWSNPEIRDKIKRRCEELEVPVVEQSCAYRSQRCSSCGLIRKANRKAKLYSCRSCGFSADSDLNAAMNHEIDLPPIPMHFLGSGKNLGEGFYWKPDGFFEASGAEIRVPCC